MQDESCWNNWDLSWERRHLDGSSKACKLESSFHILIHQTTGLFFTSPLTILNELRPRESTIISGSCWYVFSLHGRSWTCICACSSELASLTVVQTESCLFCRPEDHDHSVLILWIVIFKFFGVLKKKANFSILTFHNLSLCYFQSNVGFKMVCISLLSVIIFSTMSPLFPSLKIMKNEWCTCTSHKSYG